jgi:periplasmic protein TonB
LSVSPFGPAPSTTAKDRLTTTLFLVALLHGIVIIGVSFTVLTEPKVRSAPTLEVLLLAAGSRSSEANPDARYLSQRSQAGAGTTTEAVRAASPESSMFPAAIEGSAQGNGVEYRESVAGSRAREVLSSRSDRSSVTLQSGHDEPARENETPIALVPTPPSPVIASAADETVRLRGDTSRMLEIKADTRESALAPYLDAWKRKIERLGTVNYPRDTRQRRMSGNPVLAVTIRADGTLSEISVQRSSGRKEVDQAALNILKLASPFDPFPAALRQRYDQLRFAYEWQFLGDQGTNAGSRNSDSAPGP